MGLDPLSAAAPARVRGLVVPIGQLRQSRFAGFLKRLERENIVRLGDVSPDNRPNRTLFSPLAFPEGLVVYDLSTSVPSVSQLALTPFELYRQALLIVGIVDGCQEDDVAKSQLARGHTLVPFHEQEMLRQSLDNLKADFPSALLHQLLVFDREKSQESLPEGVMAIPSPQNSRTTTIKTVMCDLTSCLLGEMTILAKRFQNSSSFDTPKASNGLPSNDRMLSALPPYLHDSSRTGSAADRLRSFSPAGDETRLGHRMSMPAHMPSNKTSSSVTPDSPAALPASVSHTPPIMSDDMPGAPNISPPPSPRRPSHDRSRTSSQDRGTRQVQSNSLGDRDKVKGKGRLGVIIGSMYLLAGRWPDAAKELIQSANITRSNSDYVWQAKALDYLLVCLLMYGWAGMDFRIPDVLRPGAERPGTTSKSTSHKTSRSLSEVSVPHTTDPTARLATLQSMTELLPDLVNNILNLYSRAWTFTDEKIPPLSYSHSTIRLAKLLTAIRRENGSLNVNVLRSVVLKRSSRVFAGTEIKSFMSAWEVSSLLLRAYPLTINEKSMPLSERTNVLAAIASVLSELGYHRKKAVVLKELLSALLPALVQARKDGAAEMGVHPAASLATLNAATGNGFAEQSGSKEDDPEQAMRHFLSLVCESFGLITQERVQTASQHHGIQGAVASAQKNASSVAFAIQQASRNHIGSQDLKVDILRSCISICEALPNLAGALQYSAELLKTAGSGIAPGPESSNGSPKLPIEEQMRLANNISRTLSAAQHLGLRHPEADYWDEFLVRGVEIVESNPSKALIPHAKSELELVETNDAKKEKNPFIYNPFLKANVTAATEPLLVAGEEANFRITLQNLYDFDLYIERIQLEADDLHFKSHPQSIMIGPYRTQTVLLGGIPQMPGTFNVNGCLVKIRGCRERSFTTFKEPWEFKVDVKGSNIQPYSSMVEDIKRLSVDSKGPVASPLPLNVIAAQPMLQLGRISLPQSATMLLEGETQTFTIIIQNMSPTTPADLVLISFNDSIALRMQSALVSKELSEIELYEVELSTLRKQSFRWSRKIDDHDGVKIDPRGQTTFEIELLGKPGLSHGSIQVDYGYLGVPSKDVGHKFYTRQLKIPLSITVNASIDLVRSDATPLQSDFGHQQRQVAEIESSHQIQPESHPDNTSRIKDFGLASDTKTPHALFLLDFRNSWPSTLNLCLTLASQTTYHPISPGSTLRIPLPYPKIYLFPSQSHAPIPNLNPATARQFVISSSTKSSPEAELAIREAFWYREEILKQLSARWEEEATGRNGEVEMRALRLTPRMVSLVSLGDMEITMAIKTAEPEPEPATGEQKPVQQTGTQTFQIATGSFLKLRTTLRNRSDTPIQPLLRLQPTVTGQPHNVALDLGKKFLVNGVLQRALPILEPGEEKSVENSFCVLSAGLYEWNACVEEVKGAGKVESGKQRARAKTGELDVLGAVGRRVWYSEAPCIIIAHDDDTLA